MDNTLKQYRLWILRQYVNLNQGQSDLRWQLYHGPGLLIIKQQRALINNFII